MSAAGTLSVVSNAFQVVGFADTVFRAGKAVYELFDKARSASRNIALLLLELQALLSVIAFVRVVISEHASSPFATEDRQTLPNIHTILTLINQDFLHLKKLVTQNVTTWNDSWLSLLQNNIRWALQDHDIAAARDRLARYSQNLNTALSAAGRRNDIVLRTKVQAIEDKLRTIAQSNPQRALISQPKLKASQPGSHSQGMKLQINVPRTRSKVSADRLQSKHNGLKPARTLALQQTHDTGTDVFETLMPTGHNGHPKFTIYENTDEFFILDTCNYRLQDVAKPALMLHDSLSASLGSKTPSDTGSNSSIVGQIKMLIDSITVAALTAKAEAITSKYKICSGIHSSTSGKSQALSLQKIKKKPAYIVETNGPFHLEQENIRVDTNLGTVSATVLSARSITDIETLVIHFQYHGNDTLGLTPFSGTFISKALLSIPTPVASIYSIEHNVTVDYYLIKSRVSNRIKRISNQI